MSIMIIVSGIPVITFDNLSFYFSSVDKVLQLCLLVKILDLLARIRLRN